MQKGFVCLLFGARLMLGVPGPDEIVPELRIEIISFSAGVSPKYSASLERVQDRRRTADLAPDGVLRFRDVSYGEYRLTIFGGDGTPLYEQGIAVSSSTSTVILNLPVGMTSPSGSGTVSVSQLRQPIKKKASSSFRASEKLFDRGDYEGAAHKLEKAIIESPRLRSRLQQFSRRADRVGSLRAGAQ
jgi:hypothetical protein